MSRQSVAVTGYFGTGSSAVLDLLKEYEGVHIVPETGWAYEHSVFFVPGGLFSLCSQLLHGNSPQTSDMVINDFIAAMRRLNDNDFGWFGSYKSMFDRKFMDIVDDFVRKISVVKTSSNANHTIKVRFSPAKAAVQLAYHIFKKRHFHKYGLWYVKDNKPIYFSMPTEDELYAAAREFTSSYTNLFSPEMGGHIIFDHMIWPQQVEAYKKCFDSSFKVVVVVRDPRDVYISDQYMWSVPPMGHSKAHFPTDVIEFIDEWKRTIGGTSNSENLLILQFEDLVYHYEETKKSLEKFLGIKPEQHKRKGQYFKPEASIENTQVFLLKEEWREIAEQISKQIPEYIYDFGKERVPNKKLIFK